MKGRNVAQAAVVASLLLAGASGILAGKKGLTISGSTTVLPVAQKAAEVYMDMHADANISVRGGGSGVGVAALIDGVVEIANSSRPMKTEEIALARSKGVNPTENVVANDGLAVIVHKDSKISGLTMDQLKKIYTGAISSWKELGGPATAIVLVSRDVSSGTYEVFNEKALKGAKVSDGALMVASNQAVASTVAQTPGSIGYVGIGYLTDEVKALPMDNVVPSKETVLNGSYKLARKLYMYTNGQPKGEAKKFLDFILSAEGQKIVQEVGFITIK